jgi:hypothetical protein
MLPAARCRLLAPNGHGAMSDASPLCEQKRTLRRPYFSAKLGTCLPQIEIFSDAIDRRQFGRRAQRSVR